MRLRSTIYPLALLCSIFFFITCAQYQEPQKYIKPVPSLVMPSDLATDPYGNIYVADKKRVVKLSSDGNVLQSWSWGADCRGIALDHEGNMLVYGCCMRKYAPDGTYIHSLDRKKGWLSVLGHQSVERDDIHPGKEGYHQETFRGIATDGLGNIIVVYTEEHCVRKFSPEGVLMAKWGDKGPGNGQFRDPTGITVDKYGNIYVADTGNHRIQIFSPSGSFITKWGRRGRGPGQFLSPTDVAVDDSDEPSNIYVADAGNDRIQKFSGPLRRGFQPIFQGKWGMSHAADIGTYVHSSIVVDSSGDILITCVLYAPGKPPLEACIHKYRPNGVNVSGWHAPNWGTSKGFRDGALEFHKPADVAMDSSEYFYVVSADNRVQRFASDGTLVKEWKAGKDYEDKGIPSIATDNSNNVYLVYSRSTVVERYNSDGAFMGDWRTDGFIGYHGIAVDKIGHVYVTDPLSIHKFTHDGAFIRRWPTGGRPGRIVVGPQGNIHVGIYTDGRNHIGKFSPDGELLGQWYIGGGIADLEVDRSGNVYIVTSNTKDNRIQKYSEDGVFIWSWGDYRGGIVRPSAMTLDSNGSIYVTDAEKNVILKFSQDDIHPSLDASASQTLRMQLFWRPMDVTIDDLGNIYVTDVYNCCVIKFSPYGTLLRKWGAAGDSQFWKPELITVAPSGHIYVSDSENHLVHKFSANGAPLAEFRVEKRRGQLADFSGMAVDTSGNIYLNSRGVVYKLLQDGTLTAQWEGTGRPGKIAVDKAGCVYLTSGEFIMKYGSDGTLIRKWGGYQRDDSQSGAPIHTSVGLGTIADISLDALDSIYVCDVDNLCVQRFTLDGIPLGKWDLTDGSRSYRPGGIGVDIMGNLYVVDIGNHCVDKFSQEGIRLHKIELDKELIQLIR